MTHQSKSYKKFVATAATATLVASAIVPVASAAETKSFTDVNKNYKEAVDYLVANGIAKGTTDTTYGTTNSITRGDAAVMIANALGLDTENASDAGFKDLNDRVKNSVNALVEAKIVNGKTETKFAPEANITRQEMAKIVANAYGFKASTTAPFGDVNANWIEYVSALYENEVALGKTETTFAPTADVTRGEFALFVFRAETLNVAVTAEGASASNASTIVLTGTGLNKLNAENVTVDGKAVASYAPAAGGKSATITLSTKLGPDQTVPVSVKIGEETKVFNVKYNFAISSVTVDEQTFDEDRANQKVLFKINGETTAADLDYLKLAGYNITYVAKDKKTGDAANAFFKNTVNSDNTSRDGILNQPVEEKEYTVEVQLTKGGTAVVSNAATVKVVNLEQLTTEVKEATFEHGTGFEMNSNTLVAGETTNLTKVLAVIAGEEVDSIATATVKSSNPAVVSVNGKQLKAESAGTATVTVTAGNVSKTYTFTVTNSARQLSKVTTNPTNVQVVVGKTTDVTFTTLDQYGDPFAADTAAVAEIIPSGLLDAFDIITTDNNKGEFKTSLKAAKAGNGTVYFKNAANTKTYGSFNLSVSAVNNTGSTKIEITSGSKSKDNTLDMQNDKDNAVTYQVSQYNTQGLFVQKRDIADYDIKAVDGTVVNVATDSATNTFTISGKKAGTTDVLIRDLQNGSVQIVKITVVNDAQKIKDVSFKATQTIDYIGKTINYKDVLDVTNSVKDDIVNGVTLSKSTTHKVRIADQDQSGRLYLDVNGNAEYDAGDIELGYLTIATTSNTNFVVGNIVTGFTTASSADAGTILFKVMTDVADETTAIKATSILVDVK